MTKHLSFCIELDQSIGDIHSEIVDTEVEILVQLQAEVLKVEGTLQVYADACYELDWYQQIYWTPISFKMLQSTVNGRVVQRVQLD